MSILPLDLIMDGDGVAGIVLGSTAQGRDYLTRATQVKTIWIPYGE